MILRREAFVRAVGWAHGGANNGHLAPETLPTRLFSPSNDSRSKWLFFRVKLIAYSRSPTSLRMASGQATFFGLGAIQRAVRLCSRGWGGLASSFVHGSGCSVGHRPRSLGLKGHRAYHPAFLAVCCERAILKLVIVESLLIIHLRAPPLVCRVRCCVESSLMAPPSAVRKP